jgi:Domain of unknown function (DUF4381)
MNDPTSLDNLHPIVLPIMKGLWPIAPGWYLVAAFLVGVIALFVLRNLQKRKANKYRRDALVQLSVLQKTLANKEAGDALRALPVLVKSTALHAYSRNTIAALYGGIWIDFLNKTLKAPLFSKEDSVLLAQLSYGTPTVVINVSRQQTNQLFDHVQYWILHHISDDDQEKTND